MKPIRTLRSFVALAGCTMLALSSSHGQSTLRWDSNTGVTGAQDGLGAWLGANQWWTGTANTNWTSGDSAIFGNNGAGGAVSMGAGGTTVGSMTFNYFTGTYTIGTAGNAITINDGITKNAGPGVLALAGPLVLGGAQTWTNNSTTGFQASGAATLNLNGNALTFDGPGSFNMAPSGGNTMTISGGGGIIKSGTGTLTLDANPAIAHSFSGGITVNGGRVAYQTSTNVTGRGNVTLNGGYLAGRFNSSATFSGLGTGATEIRIIGGESGFSGEGTGGSTFQIGGALSVLTWGNTNFNPSVLLLGGAGANNNGVGSLNNAINLNGADRIITSTQVTNGAAGSGFTLSGAISNSTGTAGITKTGVGNLILAASNTYNGATNLDDGSITLSSATAAINSTNALNFRGGTLRLVNTANTQRVANAAGVTSTGGGTLSYENTSGTVNYTETVGSVAANGGQFNVNLATNQTGAGSQTLTMGGLSQSGTGTVTFSAAGTGPQITGNKNMIVVSGSGTTTAGQIIGAWATTGTTAALQTDYAVYDGNFVRAANITANNDETTWGSGNNINLGATATLTATRTLNSLRYSGAAANLVLGANNLKTTGLLNGGSGLLTITSSGGALTTPTGGGNLYLTAGNAGITSAAAITNNGAQSI